MSKPRSIFEDVSAQPAAARPAPAGPAPGEADRRRRANRRAISIWLMLLAALVAAMVLVGGLTRLTESGLSITEWKPVTGALPPMSEAAWQAEFEKYQTIPQYHAINRDMDLAGFKTIYWWEWGHRQLGRLVGLVWAVGFLWFLLRRKIPGGWTWRLVLPGALGGVQGAIGWWMVSSGLEGQMVSVASYRLATHLGLAFAILGLLAHYAWEVRRSGADLLQARRRRMPGPMRFAGVVAALVFVQIILGALVAGIDAGRGYIDWPLMGGEFLPSESFDYEPLWTNFFENPALVQFIHRMWGYLTLLVGLAFWWRMRRAPHAGLRRRADWVAVMMFGQVVLGVVTVIHAAPLSWSILHQAGAIALWLLVLRARFEAGWPAEERIARGKV
ncbi:COX15/CtaA family protein [Albimonas sp. CAU 1670]|uniref:heme A synthase n=1 Tax=Albimonas sp. CAU 1670 TaxID=3032599 RepID=UPI0023DCD9E2|nr:heme A synthase [Albimonas sp. CAU 1670]MDF2232870.1 COX15/CtaA family protein [Albimonas sp. CAU 1670]